MEAARREELARRLLALRAERLADARRKGSQAAELGAEVGDEADLSMADEQSELLAELDSRDREAVMAIDDALRRLEEGTYGECSHCGEPIGEERLQALPFTELCVDCQEARERERTAPGGAQRRKM